MDYTNYKVEDFATDELFIRWVLHHDADAVRFWTSFLTEHPELHETIDEARTLLLGLEKVRRSGNRNKRLDEIWENISAETLYAEEPQRPWHLFRIAATLALLISASFAIWHLLPDADLPPVRQMTEVLPGFIEEVNTTGKIKRLYLSDGSIVSLANESRLRYRPDYGGDSVRQVFLEGEAFFEVAKNPQQPFLVYANEVITKVLGTRFRVKAYGNERNVFVAVKEGKVSVYSSLEKKVQSVDSMAIAVNGVVLSSNQQVVYNRSEDAFNKSLVQLPEVVKQYRPDTDFSFHNTPIADVFATLSEAYGVEIIFPEEVMEDCFITVPMAPSDPLFDKLKIICRTIGARYELIDAKIVISSKGCGQFEHVN